LKKKINKSGGAPTPAKECNKCRSGCFSCKQKQQKELDVKKANAEFNKNMIALNRVIFTTMSIAMFVSNAILWVYLSW
jgi:hypothetical protein